MTEDLITYARFNGIEMQYVPNEDLPAALAGLFDNEYILDSGSWDTVNVEDDVNSITTNIITFKDRKGIACFIIENIITPLGLEVKYWTPEI